ncbi:MAG: four helix bundle protein [bacterium]|nr:four helix bundle protein [bacterium]
MGAITTFTEIIAWQKAHALVLEIYKITEEYPDNEKFGLVSQTRRCAVSVPSNIAEGFKRKSKNDSIHFYNIAEASLEELKYQTLLAHDLGYISKREYASLAQLLDETGKLIHGWSKIQR